MITPTEHTNIKYSTLFIASKIIKFLKKKNTIKFNDLTDMLVVELGYEVKYNINESLLFLYAFNKIDYIKELDAISIVGEKKDDNSKKTKNFTRNKTIKIKNLTITRRCYGRH